MKKLLFIIVCLLLTAVACAPTVKVKRWAAAKYDIKGVKKVGFMNFNTRLNAGTRAGMIIPETLEKGLVENGYFKVSSRIQDSYDETIKIEGMDPKDMLVVGGKPDVDAVVRGEVSAYLVDSQRSTKTVQREVVSGSRTEYYTENGVQKTREVPVKVKKDFIEPYVVKKALIDFSVDVQNEKERKSIGQGRFRDEKSEDAVGNSDIARLSSDDSMLKSILNGLTKAFVSEMAPHEVRYTIKLEKVEQCKDSNKLAQKGQWDDALSCWQGVYPETASTKYNIGVFFEATGDFEEAYNSYREAMRLENKQFYFQAASRANAYTIDVKKLQSQVEGEK
ncbi:tetratricopeptide repeat protein [Patescibacteria group bacterium]|nr:tetratricopeptide repeat protein [Patescibacteria group bacterium]